MPRLFIANTTRQHHDFCYRLPEHAIPKQEAIRAGTQMCIGGDLDLHVIALIVKQHEIYGLREAAALSRLRDFVGLCYSIDKPVPLDNLLYTFAQNDERLNQRAEERREDAAAAIAHGIRQQAAEMGVRVPRAEVETVEDARGGQPSVDNRFEILDDGVASRHGGKPGRRARANA